MFLQLKAGVSCVIAQRQEDLPPNVAHGTKTEKKEREIYNNQ